MDDFRLAIRTLRATPVVSAVAVLSLAFGIGANTAVFSLVDSLLLRQLPIADPERLVMLTTGPGDAREQFGTRTVDEIRRYAASFDGFCAWAYPGKGTVGVGVDALSADRQFVSGDYFSTLGVRPAIGRLITPADDVAGGGPDGLVAVISYTFWQRQFAGSPQAVGARIVLERQPVTVIGVTPPRFSGVIVGRSFDIALPVRSQPAIMAATPYPEDGPWLRVMLRLKRGQSLQEATTAIRAAQPAIGTAAKRNSTDAAAFLKEPFVLERAGSGASPLRERFERPLLVLLGIVGLVLLIACANVANLMLARGAARRHEMAVRLALGASRWRLVRQLFAESALIAAAGAAMALAFGTWAGRAIIGQLSTFMMPIDLRVAIDWRMLGFTAATMVATTLLFGIVPALRAGEVAPASVIKASDRQRGMGVGESRLSTGLIGLQVAISLTLTVTAALLVQSFTRLAAVPLGFDRDRAILVTVRSTTVPAADRKALYQRLVDAVTAVPGVSGTGGSMNPPIAGFMIGNFVVSEPGVAPSPQAEPFSQGDQITPGFLGAFGVTLRAGRDFEDRDGPTGQPAMIVNEAFLRRYLAGADAANAVGRAVDLTYRMPSQRDYGMGTKHIVGVVGDSVFRSIRDGGRPTIYLPLAQNEGPILHANFYVVIRAVAGSPIRLARDVAGAMLAVNRDLTLTTHAVDEQVDAALAQDRLVAWLAGFFGAIAVMLAGIGLYGMTAYSVARRRTEIGIRLALGAKPGAILRMVLGRVCAVAIAGIVAGLGAAFMTTRIIASLLYGIDAHDPSTFLLTAATLAMICGLAAFVPARRAAALDPAQVLRES